MAPPVTRRSLLRGGAAGLAVAGLVAVPGVASGQPPAGPSAPATPVGPPPASGPGGVFTLGVASGEPTPTGVVLWTRLARDPLAADGSGGMGDRPVEVEWEIADDERFARVVQRGRATAAPADGFSVHVEADGLRSGAEYLYRFRAGTEISPVGRTRTAPNPTAMSPFTLGVASCSQYEHGYFTAFRRMAEDRPDAIAFLGDYIYEYGAGQYVAPGGNVRDYPAVEARTLAQYRQRHAIHRADPDLQAAHAAAPWIVVFDDHEVENNWADDVPEQPDPAFPQRRSDALKAYWENMPLRAAQRPRGQDMQLFRRVTWGSLVTLHMLDTRQFRDDQACGDRFGTDCPERTDPRRTITGNGQEQWLAQGLRDSRARWDVLGQQVFFSQFDVTPGPARGFNPDAWDGYAVERDRITRTWVDAKVRNAVVLTGDIHRHYAADVRTDFDDPAGPVVGTELVASSITSGGNGNPRDPQIASALAENPHIRYGANLRGYVMARFAAGQLRADYRVVDDVRTPGGAVRTDASFTVGDGRPGLRRT